MLLAVFSFKYISYSRKSLYETIKLNIFGKHLA